MSYRFINEEREEPHHILCPLPGSVPVSLPLPELALIYLNIYQITCFFFGLPCFLIFPFLSLTLPWLILCSLMLSGGNDISFISLLLSRLFFPRFHPDY
jgi:hypothetical protein